MEAINATDANYAQEVLQSDKPVLVDVWAPWCAPCKMMGPAVERVAQHSQDKVKLVMANLEDLPQTVKGLNLKGTPTLIIFNKGEEIVRHAGPMTETQISEWLIQHI